MNTSLDHLIQRPESQRDEIWERQFLDAILGATVEVADDGQFAVGPDGWPYLKVKYPSENANQPLVQIVQWLAERGVGLAVNTHKMVPDYIFTYGMLWNFKEKGRFVVPNPPAPAGEVNFGEGLVMGPPAPAYLPEYVRSILRSFLSSDDGIKPKVLVATTPDYKQTDLVFGIESLGAEKTDMQKLLAEKISWFLPLHYSLAFASEKQLKGWVDL